jgi:hypothetical protein
MKKTILVSTAFALLAAVVPLTSRADVPGDHPGYLHALSDLRAARWMINHRPGDYAIARHEGEAIQKIDAAISDIRQAAIDDGKNVDDHMPLDERPDRPGRLHAAADFLRHAHDDIAHEEDNHFAHGLQHRASADIDQAMRQVDMSIKDASRGT